MDTRLERGVDVVDTIGGEEEDPLVIFQDAKEDGNEFVPLEVVGAALFEEDVGFVEQEHGVPFAGHLEDVGKRGLDCGCVEAEVAGAHHVERCAHRLGDLEVWVRSRTLTNHGRVDEDVTHQILQ